MLHYFHCASHWNAERKPQLRHVWTGYPTSFLQKLVGPLMKDAWLISDWYLTSNFCEIHCINVHINEQDNIWALESCSEMDSGPRFRSVGMCRQSWAKWMGIRAIFPLITDLWFEASVLLPFFHKILTLCCEGHLLHEFDTISVIYLSLHLQGWLNFLLGYIPSGEAERFYVLRIACNTMISSVSLEQYIRSVIIWSSVH